MKTCLQSPGATGAALRATLLLQVPSPLRIARPTAVQTLCNELCMIDDNASAAVLQYRQSETDCAADESFSGYL